MVFRVIFCGDLKQNPIQQRQTPFLLYGSLLYPLKNLLLPLPRAFTYQCYYTLPTHCGKRHTTLRKRFAISRRIGYNFARTFNTQLLGRTSDTTLPISMRSFSSTVGQYLLISGAVFVTSVLSDRTPITVYYQPGNFNGDVGLSVLGYCLRQPSRQQPSQDPFINARV